MDRLRERHCRATDPHKAHEWVVASSGMAFRCPGHKSREQRMLERLQIMCKAFGLTRDDRLELADQLLRRPDNMPITSYSQLNAEELQRMLDGLTGAVLVAHLVRERQAAMRAMRRVHNPSQVASGPPSG